MAFDFKKEQKALYAPSEQPERVTVPRMRFIAVDGSGNPNEPGGAYAKALEVLYALSYTIKMSKMGALPIEGYFDYVVAPLEGLWEMRGGAPGVDYAHKENFVWTAMIRQPEFVTEGVFDWARETALRKKKIDSSAARLFDYDEGTCVQRMHRGPYDDEPTTVASLHRFMEEKGLRADYASRRHHEIYLSDPRRGEPAKLKTVLRLPVVDA